MTRIEGDDELPEPVKLARPHGWYEVFCCTTVVLLIFAGAIVLAIFSH